MDLNKGFKLNCDNLQTVRLLIKNSPRLITKLKHVDIHQHWVRQEVEEGRLKVEWISTTEMPADGFTKSLAQQQHQKFVRQLQMNDIATLL